MSNHDPETIRSFGYEWQRFVSSDAQFADIQERFEAYFQIFPWDIIPDRAVGFDLGCGNGRWAALVAPRVGTLHCVDPSAEALEVAQRTLIPSPNCVFHHTDAESLPFPEESMDFGYSLGVLHHIPDTARALGKAVAKLKPGAPFLVYLYYAFDNRPRWYARLWRLSDAMRRTMIRWPLPLRYLLSQILAAGVYFPLARVALILEALGFRVEGFPLSGYRRMGFFMMRNDAFDRFSTPLERRFTAKGIRAMMEQAGLRDIRFSDHVPYWCAVGIKI